MLHHTQCSRREREARVRRRDATHRTISRRDAPRRAALRCATDPPVPDVVYMKPHWRFGLQRELLVGLALEAAAEDVGRHGTRDGAV